MPVGKEVVRYEDDDEEEWEGTSAVSSDSTTHSQARPGTTKRKQYYYKKVLNNLLKCFKHLRGPVCVHWICCANHCMEVCFATAVRNPFKMHTDIRYFG